MGLSVDPTLDMLDCTENYINLLFDSSYREYDTSVY